MAKKLIAALGILLFLLIAFNFQIVSYGIQQGLGQAEVLWNAQSIEELMKDTSFPDSIKMKFEYINEVKLFAEKELGLKPTENYSTYYDQGGKPILWVVTASPEFEIKAKEWCFPIAGCFPYKGFFEFKKAEIEEQNMKQKGLDTEIDEVNAWSTLGWFKDPILSSMLQRSEGRLAELIIHESTHATLYVKDSVQFNENLASFFGKKGAELFLEQRYGKNAAALKEYRLNQTQGKVFRNYMRRAIQKLDSLYQTLSVDLPIEQKRTLKQQWIDDLKDGLLASGYLENDSTVKQRIEHFQPNNAYFSGFSTYSKELPQLEIQLQEEFQGNLKQMIDSFEKKYETL